MKFSKRIVYALPLQNCVRYSDLTKPQLYALTIFFLYVGLVFSISFNAFNSSSVSMGSTGSSFASTLMWTPTFRDHLALPGHSTEMLKNKIINHAISKTTFFLCIKTKSQISCAVTARLISSFVFAIIRVQFLFFLNTKNTT